MQYLFNATEGFSRLVLEHKCRPFAIFEQSLQPTADTLGKPQMLPTLLYVWHISIFYAHVRDAWQLSAARNVCNPCCTIAAQAHLGLRNLFAH